MNAVSSAVKHALGWLVFGPGAIPPIPIARM